MPRDWDVALPAFFIAIAMYFTIEYMDRTLRRYRARSYCTVASMPITESVQKAPMRTCAWCPSTVEVTGFALYDLDAPPLDPLGRIYLCKDCAGRFALYCEMHQDWKACAQHPLAGEPYVRPIIGVCTDCLAATVRRLSAGERNEWLRAILRCGLWRQSCDVAARIGSGAFAEMNEAEQALSGFFLAALLRGLMPKEWLDFVAKQRAASNARRDT